MNRAPRKPKPPERPGRGLARRVADKDGGLSCDCCGTKIKAGDYLVQDPAPVMAKAYVIPEHLHADVPRPHLKPRSTP